MSDDSPLSTPIHSEGSDSENENGVRNTSFGDNMQSEPDGEDLLDNAHKDYKAIPELDRYDTEGLDNNNNFEPLTEQQRLEAELEIRRRYQAARGPTDLGWDSDDEIAILGRRNRMRRQREGSELDPLEELFAVDNQQPIEFQEVTGSLPTYLEKAEVRREIGRRFQDFLVHFKGNDKEPLYINKIKTMCSQNLTSLEVSFRDLSRHTPMMGVWVGDAPDMMLKIMNEAAFALVTNSALFPDFQRISSEVHVRVSELPLEDKIRDLRQMHLNCLVRFKGVVTRRTDIMPQLLLVKWKCGKCSESIGPFQCTEEKPVPPSFCPYCDAKGGFQIDSASTVYRNYQRLTVQESPGSVPAGRLPRSKEVILLADLADSCRPGEEIEITGIYKHIMGIKRSGFPVFSTVVEANHILKSGDKFSSINNTEEDEKAIIELSRDPNISDRIFSAIAPSIFGHKNIKAAIALSLFGGTRVESPGEHSVRGDINVLLMGDPGTAKSQFLKYAEQIAPRAVFTSGKGASAVGITAAVHRDTMSGEWTLEGGALVLADGGVCIIDEFDKMSENDRTALHEAMEQQTISISKAGINTVLQARCSVVAACNPVRGRYDQSLTFTQNSGLKDPIISRFDTIFVIRDTVDLLEDERLATFVVKNHQGFDQPSGGIEQDLLKKYISYARRNVRPHLTGVDKDKLINLYTDLRNQSGFTGGQSIVVRHLESIIRLSEAHARMHLRPNVIEDDTNFAIRLVLDSFISTQKYAHKRNLEKRLSKYLVYGTDKNDVLMHTLRTMVQDKVAFMQLRRQKNDINEIMIKKSEFEARARENNIDTIKGFYDSKLFRADFRETEKEIVYNLPQ